ncbi:MAG TPA: beta-ketoacyl-ACP synthase, partial [Pararhizobium sp.]|nr:beta-ketoacyl-ACP synthase [Pararhizobium sp.]
SGSAFLVLESRANAEARGAAIYATLSGIAGDRGRRDDEALAKRFRQLAAETGADEAETPLVLSGASGLTGVTASERRHIGALFPKAALRGYGGVTGHTVEATFPIGLALAALALKAGAKVPPFDPAAEQPMPAAAETIVVTAFGHARGEGIAVLSAEG